MKKINSFDEFKKGGPFLIEEKEEVIEDSNDNTQINESVHDMYTLDKLVEDPEHLNDFIEFLKTVDAPTAIKFVKEICAIAKHSEAGSPEEDIVLTLVGKIFPSLEAHFGEEELDKVAEEHDQKTEKEIMDWATELGIHDTENF